MDEMIAELRGLLERAGLNRLIADTHHTRDYAGREHGFLRNAGELVPVAGFVLRVEGMSQDQGAARLTLCAQTVNALPTLLDALTTSRDRERELEAALEPFARAADDYSWPVFERDSCSINAVGNVTVGHLRRARNALSSKDQEA